ncbi:KRSC protein, partial [Thryothorus ludovicianus]|nr:KRSC protein [Thryothorus ludovicianus]
MSCYDLCSTSGSGSGFGASLVRPQPIADSCNEPCVRQCPDSTAVIQPPAVVVTFPGPILSSFPQDSVVGSAGAPVLAASGASRGLGGSGGSSMGFGGLGGLGGSSMGYGGLGSCGGLRGLSGSGRAFGSCWAGSGRGGCGSC